MSSSHSYLQNLDATTATTQPVHQLSDGVCIEYFISDLMVKTALANTGIAGPCSKTEYT